MNKEDFKSFIAKQHNCTQLEAEKIIKIFTDSICSVLVGGNEVKLIGFGNFSVSDIAQREGRNPRTGEKILIPAYRKVKFTAGKKLKEACNN